MLKSQLRAKVDFDAVAFPTINSACQPKPGDDDDVEDDNDSDDDDDVDDHVDDAHCTPLSTTA